MGREGESGSVEIEGREGNWAKANVVSVIVEKVRIERMDMRRKKVKNMIVERLLAKSGQDSLL
jgi:hypothetical protein